MGIASVTILILAVLILALTGLLMLLVKDYMVVTRSASQWEKSCDLLTAENGRLKDLHVEHEAHIERLLGKLAQIPLTPKPKENNNGPVQARTSGAVRHMTEQAFGKKPD